MDDQRANRESGKPRYRRPLVLFILVWVVSVFLYFVVLLHPARSFAWSEFAFWTFVAGPLVSALAAFLDWLQRLNMALMIRAAEATSRKEGEKK
jgi:hypothetical protein